MKLTETKVKQLAGTFDLELVTCLDASNRGVSELGCIPQCKNLTDLDLSNNKFKSLESFKNVPLSIRRINLAGNEIHTLRGVEVLKYVEELNLCGNPLCSWDELSRLVSLTKLRALYLKPQDREKSGPWEAKDYESRVAALLPNLALLDGGHLKIKQSAAMDKLDKLLPKLPDVQLSESKPWLAGYDWGSAFESKSTKVALEETALRLSVSEVHQQSIEGLENLIQHVNMLISKES